MDANSSQDSIYKSNTNNELELTISDDDTDDLFGTQGPDDDEVPPESLFASSPEFTSSKLVTNGENQLQNESVNIKQNETAVPTQLHRAIDVPQSHQLQTDKISVQITPETIDQINLSAQQTDICTTESDTILPTSNLNNGVSQSKSKAIPTFSIPYGGSVDVLDQDQPAQIIGSVSTFSSHEQRIDNNYHDQFDNDLSNDNLNEDAFDNIDVHSNSYDINQGLYGNTNIENDEQKSEPEKEAPPQPTQQSAVPPPPIFAAPPPLATGPPPIFATPAVGYGMPGRRAAGRYAAAPIPQAAAPAPNPIPAPAQVPDPAPAQEPAKEEVDRNDVTDPFDSPQQQVIDAPLFGSPPKEENIGDDADGIYNPFRGEQKNHFAQPAPLFGQPEPSEPLFGAPEAAPAPLFGQPPPEPAAVQERTEEGGPTGDALFGPPGDAEEPQGLFGAPNPQQNVFGQSEQAPEQNLFGPPGDAINRMRPLEQTSLFGQPQTVPKVTPDLFSRPQPPQSNLFGGHGNEQQSDLFGENEPEAESEPEDLFGSQEEEKPALFGQQVSEENPETLFGQQEPQQSLFGQPEPAPEQNLFGQPEPQSNIFGAPAAQQEQSNLFGPAETEAQSSLFGQPEPQPLLGAPASPVKIPQGRPVLPTSNSDFASNSSLKSLQSNDSLFSTSDFVDSEEPFPPELDQDPLPPEPEEEKTHGHLAKPLKFHFTPGKSILANFKLKQAEQHQTEQKAPPQSPPHQTASPFAPRSNLPPAPGSNPAAASPFAGRSVPPPPANAPTFAKPPFGATIGVQSGQAAPLIPNKPPSNSGVAPYVPGVSKAAPSVAPPPKIFNPAAQPQQQHSGPPSNPFQAPPPNIAPSIVPPPQPAYIPGQQPQAPKPAAYIPGVTQPATAAPSAFTPGHQGSYDPSAHGPSIPAAAPPPPPKFNIPAPKADQPAPPPPPQTQPPAYVPGVSNPQPQVQPPAYVPGVTQAQQTPPKTEAPSFRAPPPMSTFTAPPPFNSPGSTAQRGSGGGFIAPPPNPSAPQQRPGYTAPPPIVLPPTPSPKSSGGGFVPPPSNPYAPAQKPPPNPASYVPGQKPPSNSGVSASAYVPGQVPPSNTSAPQPQSPYVPGQKPSAPGTSTPAYVPGQKPPSNTGTTQPPPPYVPGQNPPSAPGAVNAYNPAAQTKGSNGGFTAPPPNVIPPYVPASVEPKGGFSDPPPSTLAAGQQPPYAPGVQKPGFQGPPPPQIYNQPQINKPPPTAAPPPIAAPPPQEKLEKPMYVPGQKAEEPANIYNPLTQPSSATGVLPSMVPRKIPRSVTTDTVNNPAMLIPQQLPSTFMHSASMPSSGKQSSLPYFRTRRPIMAFGFGGQFVTLKPQQGLEIRSVRSAYSVSNIINQLQNFKTTDETVVNKFIDDRIKAVETGNDALLWSAVKVRYMSKNNIDPLAFSANAKQQNTPEYQLVHQLSHHTESMNVPTGYTIQGDPRKAEQLQAIIVTEGEGPALQFAINNRLWDFALLISSSISPESFKETARMFLSSALQPSPIQKILMAITGQTAEASQDTWQVSLSTLLRHLTPSSITNLKSMADFLVKEGNIAPAHVCRLLSSEELHRPPEDFALVGTDWRHPTISAIQMSQLVCTKLSPEFYVYAVYYTMALLDYGFIDIARMNQQSLFKLYDGQKNAALKAATSNLGRLIESFMLHNAAGSKLAKTFDTIITRLVHGESESTEDNEADKLPTSVSSEPLSDVHVPTKMADSPISGEQPTISPSPSFKASPAFNPAPSPSFKAPPPMNQAPAFKAPPAFVPAPVPTASAQTPAPSKEESDAKMSKEETEKKPVSPSFVAPPPMNAVFKVPPKFTAPPPMGSFKAPPPFAVPPAVQPAQPKASPPATNPGMPYIPGMGTYTAPEAENLPEPLPAGDYDADNSGMNDVDDTFMLGGYDDNDDGFDDFDDPKPSPPMQQAPDPQPALAPVSPPKPQPPLFKPAFDGAVEEEALKPPKPAFVPPPPQKQPPPDPPKPSTSDPPKQPKEEKHEEEKGGWSLFGIFRKKQNTTVVDLSQHDRKKKYSEKLHRWIFEGEDEDAVAEAAVPPPPPMIVTPAPGAPPPGGAPPTAIRSGSRARATGRYVVQ